MAEENPQVQPSERKIHRDEEQRLKHLDFVQVGALYALTCFLNLYEYAKDKSGPLKPGVETVEGTVKAVVEPVYHKFHKVPKELLKFVDRKVDDTVVELDRCVPQTLKQASYQALTTAQKAPEVARAIASEVKSGNVKETAYEIARNVYSKYEPKAEQYAVWVWRLLNKLPLFPQVADLVVPKAAYCSEMYNEAVRSTSKRGYWISSYLPLVPTESIARLFSEEDTIVNEPVPVNH